MLGQEQSLPPLLRSLLSPSVISGDTGSQVVALQRNLTTVGFAITATGTYDEATRAAVAAFQKRIGLPVTGVVGARTQAALARAVDAAKAKAAQAGTGLALMSPILVVAAGIVALVALGAAPRRRGRLGELTAAHGRLFQDEAGRYYVSDGISTTPSYSTANQAWLEWKAIHKPYSTLKGLGQVVTEPLWRAVGIFPDEGVEVANQRTGQTRVIPFTTARMWIGQGRLEPITEEQIEGCDCAPKARKYGLVASNEGLGIRMAFPTKQWFARIRGSGVLGPLKARTESEAKKEFRFKFGHWPSQVWQA